MPSATPQPSSAPAINAVPTNAPAINAAAPPSATPAAAPPGTGWDPDPRVYNNRVLLPRLKKAVQVADQLFLAGRPHPSPILLLARELCQQSVDEGEPHAHLAAEFLKTYDAHTVATNTDTAQDKPGDTTMDGVEDGENVDAAKAEDKMEIGGGDLVTNGNEV